MKLIDGKYLDQEEKELIESVERGEWHSLPPKENKNLKTILRKAVIKKYKTQTKPVTIRISEYDISLLKEKAKKE